MQTRHTRALVQPGTINAETREVDVVFATERPIPTCGWDEDYDEILVCEQGAVRMERAERGLPVMDCHNTYSVFNQIGRAHTIWFNDKRELCARIQFSNRPQVEELFKDIEAGIVRDISVGYNIYKYEREEKEGAPRPIYRAVDWMPTEISFAPVQADIGAEVRAESEQHTVEIIQNSKIMDAKKRQVEKGKTVDYVVEGGAVKAGDKVITDDVTGIALQDGEVGDTVTLSLIEAEPDEQPDNTTDAGDDKPTDAEQRSAKTPNEKARMNAILTSTRAAKLPDSYAIELWKSEKPLSVCRQLIIEKTVAERSTKNVINGTHGVEVGVEAVDKKRNAIRDAILNRVQPAKFELAEGTRNFRGMTLYEMSKELLIERGVNVRGKSKSEVADMIFGKRSVSTSDMPLIFEGVIDKMLRTDHEFAPEYWDKIAKQVSLPDYREKGLYQFGVRNGMKETQEGGEIKYTVPTESKETIRLKSYAEGISITRHAFINDDLSVLDKIPTYFVKDWNELRGDLVWGLIIDNVKLKSDDKPLFDAAHGNILTGANSALSETSLAAAKVLMSKQKSIDNRLMRILPKFLIVPPELEITARKLITSITPAKSEDVNVFANAFTVIVEPRLSDSTAWYLAADPNAYDGLNYGYLEGNESLRVNSKDDFDKDTFDYAVRGDFGVAAIDFRSLLKSKGKA